MVRASAESGCDHVLDLGWTYEHERVHPVPQEHPGAKVGLGTSDGYMDPGLPNVREEKR